MSGQQLRYQPIHKLPDVTLCDVVLLDSYSGLHITPPIVAPQAREWREDGVYTHFLLLPSSPGPRGVDHDHAHAPVA